MSVRRLALDQGWQLARTPAGRCHSPGDLPAVEPRWHEARVPGTVASALRCGLDSPARYDADDWWYRVTFAAPQAAAGARHRLRFDGLATLAQAWLNGQPILESRNMFVGHRVDVTPLLRDVNHLVIRFASLHAELARKRPRPRWKTALVESQNLRWLRTTLLGRMPGWAPLVEAVGPWGEVALETVERVEVVALDLQARAEGGVGRVQLRAAAARADGRPIEGARLLLQDAVHPLRLLQGHEARIHGDLAIEGVPLWWPHTHGEPTLVPWKLQLRVDGEWIDAEGGAIGFRDIALDTADGRVRFSVNGVPVFCRGACWVPPDVLSLRATATELRATLESARDAGANMLRVGGTMVYESDAFYALCDELGILVWQDFMFANMDYPVDDAAFRAEIEAEARHQLARLQRHACIAAYCGGSEVAQQAAMMGLPAEQWSNDFFTATLPALCSAAHSGIPYFASTPWGGALPFHVGSGIAHYYGVGAYRRPLADVKSARVKFAAECLGFANVPDGDTMRELTGSATPAPHHPRWKARVPRDNGAGWDFEDVRDHYLQALYGVDAGELRREDLGRYFAMSREASGEVMRRVFAEWRSPASECGGALVWLYRDPWPGAGWGVVDAAGRPKAAWWHLRRAWRPRSVHLTDEGLDGLAIHVVNESAQLLDASIELEMYRHGRTLTASARASLLVPARAAVTRHADALLGRFSDANRAYRFGPAEHDVIVVRLRENATGMVLGEDFHFPLGMNLPPQRAAALRHEARWRDDGRLELTLQSDAFLQSVSVACDGFKADDDHFHLAPNAPRRLVLAPLGERVALRGWLEALNLPEPVALRAPLPSTVPGTTQAGTRGLS